MTDLSQLPAARGAPRRSARGNPSMDVRRRRRRGPHARPAPAPPRRPPARAAPARSWSGPHDRGADRCRRRGRHGRHHQPRATASGPSSSTSGSPQVVVDVVTHGSGPGARWASAAAVRRPGHRRRGRAARSCPVDRRPGPPVRGRRGRARRPSLSMLESLPRRRPATPCWSWTTPDQLQPTTAPDGSVTWLVGADPRRGRSRRHHRAAVESDRSGVRRSTSPANGPRSPGWRDRACDPSGVADEQVTWKAYWSQVGGQRRPTASPPGRADPPALAQPSEHPTGQRRGPARSAGGGPRRPQGDRARPGSPTAAPRTRGCRTTVAPAGASTTKRTSRWRCGASAGGRTSWMSRSTAGTTTRRPSMPVSSEASRRADAGRLASPSRWPPGWSQRWSLVWKSSSTRSAAASTTRAEPVKWPATQVRQSASGWSAANASIVGAHRGLSGVDRLVGPQVAQDAAEASSRPRSAPTTTAGWSRVGSSTRAS